jgi:uncharacterized protein
MTSTQILRVRIVDASAKVRAGTSHDDRGDLKNEELRGRTWIGVVPSWTAYGQPIASPDNWVAKVSYYLFDKRDGCTDEIYWFRSILQSL